MFHLGKKGIAGKHHTKHTPSSSGELCWQNHIVGDFSAATGKLISYMEIRIELDKTPKDWGGGSKHSY